ncbi:hypothetical protein DSCO28_65930 [Desulfosarcina ovata subsp. sediminis]|uniref:Lipoprotein n=1 Tax=Desulfosarcina ovata subsp. sediminis TaxID=885957 RepID=A0A5K8A0H4_9BACT|nr:hypothetical protein [Desulfosarcina ovata]BBO86027.1 hypothetical protein DSCO28_65930 [Desulfosarcina ovata subsp. sediminis]
MNISEKSNSTLMLIALSVFWVIMAMGCSGVTPRLDKSTNQRFEAEIGNLIESIVSKKAYAPRMMAPASVIPGSFKSDLPYSRLEELVMERLALRVRETRDLYTLSRQNWFECREGRPMTFYGAAFGDWQILKNLIVYEVTASSEDILNQVKVRITASDANGRTIPGVVGEATFDYAPGTPAYELYQASQISTPFPEGLEERPYESIDRLAYSLTAELVDAYRAGIEVGGHHAADEDIRVLLFVKESSARVDRGFQDLIQNTLQQAMVGNRGVSCVVSQEDFGPVFRQIDFYHKTRRVFDMDESMFKAGTVLLMTEMFRHPDGDKIGVALRALWRVSPLESRDGDFIPTNVAGTYLSGFTSKAYVINQRVQGAHRDHRRPVTVNTPADYAPLQDLDICFYQFTDVYEKRIYPVLIKAPGLSEIRREDALCDDQTACRCYVLRYAGNLDEISGYLRRNLRTSTVLPFRLVPKGYDLLEVHFERGFD